MRKKSRIIKQAVEQKSATTGLDRQICNYLEFLRLEKNLSPQTLVSYKFDFDKYRCYLIHSGVHAASGVTEEHIGKFLAMLHRRNLTARSVARILSTIRGFHRYLLGEEVVKDDPTQIIDSPKQEKNLPEVLNIFEVDEILKQPDTKEIIQVRSQQGSWVLRLTLTVIKHILKIRILR